MSNPNPVPATLQLVVQVGFAGSRELVDTTAHPTINVAAFEQKIEDWLVKRFAQLRLDLLLQPHHFFCGISALAIGGDMVFSRACAAANIPHRVFLPQTRDEFLEARGSKGPDFPDPSQKAEALRLLASQHVIQERIVSEAAKRNERFDDTNREIVRVSDLLICLLRANAAGKPGGTEEAIKRAVQRGKPVLVIAVDVDAATGEPVFTEKRRLPIMNGTPLTLTETFKLPKLPSTLAALSTTPAPNPPPTPIGHYASTVKHMASPHASQMQSRFKRFATNIVTTHVIATVLASVALALATIHVPYVMPVLLIVELVMLLIGWNEHKKLHKSRVSYQWAEARLLAEVARSVLAVDSLHVYLKYLYSLPFPGAIRPVLRTMSVLHLSSTRHNQTPWQQKRDQYVDQRLKAPQKGQISFYDTSADKAAKLLHKFEVAFRVFWRTAFVATSLKLALHPYMEEYPAYAMLLTGIMGTLAIAMPVLAAGALSMAVALDLEPQVHTYREMQAFLQGQLDHFNSATSDRDYADLVLETESQLLGETANWFSRRSFATVP